MERREFLRLGGLAVVGSGSTGCAHILGADGGLSIEAMEDVLAGIDRMVSRVRGWFPVQPASNARAPEWQLAQGLADVLASLAVYSAFTDLPLAGQVYPGMQARLEQAGVWLQRGQDTLVPIIESDDPEFWGHMEHGRRQAREREALLADADLELEELGVGSPGRRRFGQLLKHSARELSAKNTKELARAQLAAARREGPEQTLPEDALSEAVARAQRDWIAAGVPEADFKRPGLSTERLRKYGIRFIVGGSISFVVGVALIGLRPDCWCFGAVLVVAGLAMLIPGIILFTNAERRRKEEESIEGG